MEQIYTIPVNEAFEESAAGGHECPFCLMRRKLEENEIDLLLGASMMEPDVRIKTNALGFCPRHFGQLYSGGKALPFALIMESHLNTVRENLKGAGAFSGMKAAADLKTLEKLNSSCYVCDRIDYHFTRMIDTAVFLWDHDDKMKKNVVLVDRFCFPHYTQFVKAAKAQLDKKRFSLFYGAVWEVMDRYTAKLSENVSAFAKQFDYRYVDEQVSQEVKAAPGDAMRLFSGDNE